MGKLRCTRTAKLSVPSCARTVEEGGQPTKHLSHSALALAVPLPCLWAMPLPCLCHVFCFAMLLPWFAIPVPCMCHVFAMLMPWFAMPLPCLCHVRVCHVSWRFASGLPALPPASRRRLPLVARPKGAMSTVRDLLLSAVEAAVAERAAAAAQRGYIEALLAEEPRAHRAEATPTAAVPQAAAAGTRVLRAAHRGPPPPPPTRFASGGSRRGAATAATTTAVPAGASLCHAAGQHLLRPDGALYRVRASSRISSGSCDGAPWRRAAVGAALQDPPCQKGGGGEPRAGGRDAQGALRQWGRGGERERDGRSPPL